MKAFENGFFIFFLLGMVVATHETENCSKVNTKIVLEKIICKYQVEERMK